jgi:hypothetical protein
MHFQIYFPGLVNEDPAKLDAIQKGLSAGALWHAILDKGPDGGPGCAVWWGVAGYIPGKLKWIPSIERDGSPAGAYWIGYDPQAMPAPYELAWKNRFDGYAITLGDGNEWVIPSAGMLPRVRRLNPEGRLYFALSGAFDWYWSEAAQWFDVYANASLDAINLTLDGSCWDYAARALGINYRMPPELPLILSLFDTTNIIRVIGATIQALRPEDVAELIKKPVAAE